MIIKIDDLVYDVSVISFERDDEVGLQEGFEIERIYDLYGHQDLYQHLNDSVIEKIEDKILKGEFE